jgi:hypothetical protein
LPALDNVLVLFYSRIIILEGARHGIGGKQGFVVDTDTFVLRRNRVLVQNTPKAVLVMGFGPGTPGQLK